MCVCVCVCVYVTVECIVEHIEILTDIDPLIGKATHDTVLHLDLAHTMAHGSWSPTQVIGNMGLSGANRLSSPMHVSANPAHFPPLVDRGSLLTWGLSLRVYIYDTYKCPIRHMKT